MSITVSSTVRVPLATAWMAYTDPAHVVHWNFAAPSWHCPRATADLRVGGRFSSRMEARDGSVGFDFEGTYTKIVDQHLIAYEFGGRHAEVRFEPVADGAVTVSVTFDPETTHPIEQQRGGWQAILDNYARHAEAVAAGGVQKQT